ncbi:MAG: GH25 family lysozyme [Lacipirellulaceae bacterium]
MVRFCAFAAVACSGSDSISQRVRGIDVSAWQGSISQTTWNNLRNVDDQRFAFIRSSRGGTTGVYNQNDPNNTLNGNTLSQRYDDQYFVQNITRATAAGIYAGPYHFSRPDVIATTQNANGIANTGLDEANHFLQMAGPWMRPGYILPVFDLEAGDGFRTDAQITQFSIDFSNRIFDVTGVRPIMYINGNYAANVVQSSIVDAFPVLWVARYPNQANPNSINIQTGHPKDSFAQFYGPWDDAPRPTHPWHFWQYASTGRLSSFNNGGTDLDVNVAQGGIEFVKDQLVPALWVNNADGNWSTVANWNSGQTAVAPVQGPGQPARIGTMVLPSARLPGIDDTVILDRTAANVTVTLDAGTHNLRKLVARESLNVTGGSLNVNYVPLVEANPFPSPFTVQVAAPVSITGGSVSAHTVQVDSTQTLTLGGGTVTFDTVNLVPATTSGSLALSGDVTLAPLGSATAKVQRGTGSGSAGAISLGGATRTVTVNNGSAAVDVSFDAAVTNGGLNKGGAGVLRLSQANTFAGGTTVSAGVLQLTNSTGSATGTGPVNVAVGGTLGGTGTASGAVTVGGTIAPGVTIGRLNTGSMAFAAGSTLAIDVNSAASFDTVGLGGSLAIDPAATLQVTFGPGYAPAFGTTFSLFVGATSRSGAFGTLTSNGPALVARGVGNGVVLEVLSGLAGDFNNDGAVDTADFTVWAESYGSSASALLNTAASGSVDASHYTVWRDNIGASLPASARAAAVPEPTAAALGLCGFAIFGSRSIARRRAPRHAE